jgi:transcriptional regulator with XRE-family HTH domain
MDEKTGGPGHTHEQAEAEDALSFGRYLKALRQEKGITLEAVASETCITRGILRFLEAEDHAGLPDEVFVKGFLRSYAGVLGTDPDDILQRYQAHCRLHRRPVRHRTDSTRSGRRFWFWIMGGLTVLACLILVPAALMHHPDRIEKPPLVNRPAAVSSAQEKPPAPMAPVSPVAIHHLTVRAVAETWMKVIIDGKMPRKYTLHAGDQLKLSATRDFNLLIGNAGGVVLMFDDKEVPVPGKTGQTITLWLPRRHGR